MMTDPNTTGRSNLPWRHKCVANRLQRSSEKFKFVSLMGQFHYLDISLDQTHHNELFRAMHFLSRDPVGCESDRRIYNSEKYLNRLGEVWHDLFPINLQVYYRLLMFRVVQFSDFQYFVIIELSFLIVYVTSPPEVTSLVCWWKTVRLNISVLRV